MVKLIIFLLTYKKKIQYEVSMKEFVQNMSIFIKRKYNKEVSLKMFVQHMSLKKEVVGFWLIL